MVTYLRVLIYLSNIFIRIKGLDIPKEIYNLCPYSNICYRNASSTFDSHSFSSCCASCGCDEECGLRLDCCFDELDKYKLVENGKVVCVKPFSGSLLRTSDVQSYYMVKTCAAGNDKYPANCRLTDEFGNSLLLPVSSLDTNSIYVNLECALCNNLNSTLLKQWDLLLLSSFELVDQSLTLFIEENIKNDVSLFVYVPPSEENWSHKFCYDEYFEVEDCTINNEWQTLCTTLRAPFVYGLAFRNIFCVLCFGEQPSKLYNFCESKTYRGRMSTMMILLNNSVKETSKQLISVQDTNVAIKTRETCPSGYIVYLKETCLRVYCPEGMIETPDGCVHLALRWYMAFLSIQVKLLQAHGTALPVSLLPTSGTHEAANPRLWLKSPCREGSVTVVNVYVSTADHETTEVPARNNYVSSFIVQLTKKVGMAAGIDPSLAVPLFKKCFDEKWTVKVDKKTYLFEASFDKHSSYVQDGIERLRKFPSSSALFFEDFARPALYKLIAEGPVKPNKPELILKKPFFCNQVRIPTDDVIVGFGEIRIKSRNISFGTNEYLVNEPLLDGNINLRDVNKTTFAICVEDFDPSYKDNSMNGNRAWTNEISFLDLYMPIICMISLFALLL